MIYIIIFILGILTPTLIIPFIESISEIILTWLEYVKSKPVKRVLIKQNEIADLQSDLEETNTFAMGFQVPSDEKYCDDGEDWEDKK